MINQFPINSIGNAQKKGLLKHSPVFNCASEPIAIGENASVSSLTSWFLGKVKKRDNSVDSKTSLSCSISIQRSASSGSCKTSASNSVSSIKSERRVKFKDEENNNTPMETSHSSKNLVKIAYFETLMESKEPWEDPYYYAGFREVFTAGQLWLSDISSFPFAKNASFEVRDKDGNCLYIVEKHQQAWMTLAHSLFRFVIPWWKLRNGFTITIFSHSNRVPLIQFKRKSHFCADQLDIVETVYIQDKAYVGRIERTAHGYLIRDKDNRDIYRVLESRPKDLVNKKTQRSWNHSKRKQLKLYRTDTKEVVGRIVYQQRGVLRRPFTHCLRTLGFGLVCNPDVGTNAKLLMLGTLFFHLHQKDKYKDNLPLGSDAKRPLVTCPHEVLNVASVDIIP